MSATGSLCCIHSGTYTDKQPLFEHKAWHITTVAVKTIASKSNTTFAQNKSHGSLKLH